MDKITPHMYAAAALVLVAIFCTYQGVLSKAVHVEITNKELKLEPDQSEMPEISSQQVLSAMGKEPKRLYQNPFLEPLKREGASKIEIVELKVPKPPAPKFKLPSPPVLPLPGEK